MRKVGRFGIQRCIDREAKRGSGTHDEYEGLLFRMIVEVRRKLR